jgi:hypothetical protein
VKNNIKIFYHVLLENHWYTIVKEQLEKLKNSKLLENCSTIYFTLSTPDNIDIVEKNNRLEFFYNHILHFVYEDDIFYNKKFEIIESKKSEFEFPTLEKAIKESKESKEFIGFYFHTKGVSKPDYVKDQWRDALNVGCIDHWDIHVSKIIEGYDMSGINLLHRNKHQSEYKSFYSGNFFFFNPNFFSNIDFSLIDKSNRFAAESIYGFYYNPKFFNLGYQGLDRPFLRTVY